MSDDERPIADESRFGAVADSSGLADDDIADFLGAIWGDGPHTLARFDRVDGQRFEVLGHFDTPCGLLAEASVYSDSACLYFGPAWVEAKQVNGKRGGQADMGSCAWLWADLDWLDDAHANPDLPVEAVVRRVLGSVLHPPTIVICTGHGLQAYWCLDTPVHLSWWQSAAAGLRAMLEAVGLVVERTEDLASMMRLPGSLNTKRGGRVPVAIESNNGPTYSVTTFMALQPPPPPPPPTQISTGGVSGNDPAEWFNEYGPVSTYDLLVEDGWTFCHRVGTESRWARPGKTKREGHSGVLHEDGQHRLVVFSSSLPEKYHKVGKTTATGAQHSLSRFALLAAVRCDGDMSEAARLVGNMMPVGGPCPDTGGQEKVSMRDLLIDLAEADYRICRTEDDRPFLVPNEGNNVALMSGAAKRSLAVRFRQLHGKAPGRTPVDEAWHHIEGLAADAPKQPLPLRVARHDEAAVIDIGDGGRTVIVTRDGWEVVERSPVTFRRSKALLPLPVPERAGNVDELFELLAIEEHHQDLLLAWMVAALIEDMPHPIAAIRGPQGSAKTSTCRALSRLLDPCMADTQKPPKDPESWDVACSSRWVVAIDNVSTIPEWWSDAMCRAVTGAGWARRALYTDDDEVITKYRRCIIVNGITLGGSMRADLQERLMAFDLTRPNQYLTERQVDVRLDSMAPRVLGALFDMLSRTLAAFADIEHVDDLRMADFATILRAFDKGNDRQAEAAYRKQMADAFADAYEADEFAQAVVGLVKVRGEWVGTMGALLADLNRHSVTPAHWPRTASALSSWLERSAVTLARAGVEHEKMDRTARGRPHRLRWVGP